MPKIGDCVIYKGAWGTNAATKAFIEGMEKVTPGEKEGVEVPEASWEDIHKGAVVLDLSDGHWAYGWQVDIEASKKLGVNDEIYT